MAVVLTGTVFVNRSKVNEEISELLKEATDAKAANPEAAVAILRKAYRKMRRTKTHYGVQTFLRLPMYLQAAGQGQEALDELDRLFRDGCPNSIGGERFRLMEQAAVLDKKRLVLQRQKAVREAVPVGVLSWVLDVRAEMVPPSDGYSRLDVELRRLQDNVDRLRNPEFWTPKLAKLLKPAKVPHAEADVRALVAQWMSSLPAADDDEHVRQLASLLRS